ncbi:MAG: nucleotidyl transferase AbiEii/AbiGii toxin family protein [Ruminococcus sp.]|nr:nucleotidyl transferase AbiEii/AbiGii toxin family protein [Ruminococcus sp.]
MTEKEKLMYDILARISGVDAPIVFKGALITKMILAEHGFTDVQRMTKDIDANWIGTPPTMSDLAGTIYQALGDLKNQFSVEATREYGEGKSAGLTLRDKATGDKVISMDIDIKPSAGNRIYYFGEASIKGVLPSEILADKISSMSSDAVYKHRAKDIVDVYSLSHCVQVNIKDVCDACERANREIQSFDAFYNRRSDIEHAYNKLKGIEGKPEFAQVYTYLSKFIQPFAERDFTNKIWNPQCTSWQEQHQKQRGGVYVSRETLKKSSKELAEKRSKAPERSAPKKKRDTSLE